MSVTAPDRACPSERPATARALNRYWNERLDPLDWKRAAGDDTRARWNRALESFAAPHVLRAIDGLGDLRGRRVLDLGCGAGYGSVHLARQGARVIGLDVADRRCAVARREIEARAEPLDLTFVCGHSEQLPFADGSFDAIFASDVLMYSDPGRVVAECRRVLVPGGRVAFIEALAGNPLVDAYRRLTAPGDGYGAFTRHLRLDELRACGERLVHEASRGHYLFSASAFACLFHARSTWLYRLVLRLLGPLDDWILSRFPGTNAAAWRATAVFRKPVTDVG